MVLHPARSLQVFAPDDGGAGTPPPTVHPATPPPPPPAPAAGGEAKPGSAAGEYPDGLGDAGKRALDAERAARRDAEKLAKDREAELEKLREAAKTEDEKKLDAARAEGRQSALEVANARMLKSEVKALAASKLNDPNDAVAMLDLTKFKVDDDGNVDNKAISSAIDELVKTKPYLARGAKPGPLPGGGAKPSNGISMDDQIRRAAGRS